MLKGTPKGHPSSSGISLTPKGWLPSCQGFWESKHSERALRFLDENGLLIKEKEKGGFGVSNSPDPSMAEFGDMPHRLKILSLLLTIGSAWAIANFPASLLV